MKNSRKPIAINAGSMADIAFLLLLFFLVSTTISQEKGIVRKLPNACKTQDCTADIAERNILRIYINETGEIMINDALTELSLVSVSVQNFVDNNGAATCEYCNGAQLTSASVHPTKAVISLSSHRLAPYGTFLSVQDALTHGYKTLRTNYANAVFQKEIESLTYTEITTVRKAYPFKVSEASIVE